MSEYCRRVEPVGDMVFSQRRGGDLGELPGVAARCTPARVD
jgi:hypothetical protein